MFRRENSFLETAFVHKMKKGINAMIGVGRKSRSCYNFCCPTAHVCWVQDIQRGFAFLKGREAAGSNVMMVLVAGQWVTDILQLFAIFLWVPLFWKQMVTFRGSEMKTLAYLFEGEDTSKPIPSGYMVTFFECVVSPTGLWITPYSSWCHSLSPWDSKLWRKERTCAFFIRNEAEGGLGFLLTIMEAPQKQWLCLLD